MGARAALVSGDFLVATERVSIIRTRMPSAAFSSARRAAQTLLNGACFAAAFIASAACIGWCLPFPAVPAIGPKYRYLAENAARFDTLFIGSSRVFHQIDPQQFDAEVAALGGRTQSANLAYDSVWPPESFYFLRRLLALRPPHLRWVFIELMQLNVNLETRNDQTLRTAYWHDWRHTWIAWREVFASPRSPAEKWRLAAEHAVIFIRWNANLGRGAEALRATVLPGKPEHPEHWLDRAGFLPENDRHITDEELPQYLQTVARLRTELPPHPASALYFSALEDLTAEVRRAGAQPVFLLTPSLSAAENFTGLPAGVPVLAFNDPGKYPTLYEPERHYDTWHLNEKGAAEFTGLLAHRFVEHLHRPPPSR